MPKANNKKDPYEAYLFVREKKMTERMEEKRALVLKAIYAGNQLEIDKKGTCRWAFNFPSKPSVANSIMYKLFASGSVTKKPIEGMDKQQVTLTETGKVGVAALLMREAQKLLDDTSKGGKQMDQAAIDKITRLFVKVIDQFRGHLLVAHTLAGIEQRMAQGITELNQAKEIELFEFRVISDLSNNPKLSERVINVHVLYKLRPGFDILVLELQSIPPKRRSPRDE